MVILHTSMFTTKDERRMIKSAVQTHVTPTHVTQTHVTQTQVTPTYATQARPTLRFTRESVPERIVNFVRP